MKHTFRPKDLGARNCFIIRIMTRRKFIKDNMLNYSAIPRLKRVSYLVPAITSVEHLLGLFMKLILQLGHLTAQDGGSEPSGHASATSWLRSIS